MEEKTRKTICKIESPCVCKKIVGQGFLELEQVPACCTRMPDHHCKILLRASRRIKRDCLIPEVLHKIGENVLGIA